MKSIHFTNYFHASSGGIGTYYRQLLAAANRCKRPVRLVVPGAEDAVEEVGEYGRIYHIRAVKSPVFDSRYRLILPHQYLLPGDSAIKRLLRREDPDLIEICDKYSLIYLAAALRKGWIRGVRRVPLLGHSAERMDRNVSVFLHSGALGQRLARIYIKWIYLPLCDFHMACSVHTAAELADASAQHTTHRRLVYACPMGVEAARFHPSLRDEALRGELLSRCGKGPGDRLALYAGRLSPEKNLGLLAETLQALQASANPAYCLVIAGDGPSREQFHSQLRSAAPGSFLTLGHVSDPAYLARLYASADVFVHPNPHEPYGIAPLEAMASGTPLVAPESGGVLSYAKADNAWLGPPDATAFAALVRAASGDDPSRERKLQAARRTAERNDWPLVTDRCFALYDRVVAEFPTWFGKPPDDRLVEPVLQLWDGEDRVESPVIPLPH